MSGETKKPSWTAAKRGDSTLQTLVDALRIVQSEVVKMAEKDAVTAKELAVRGMKDRG